LRRLRILIAEDNTADVLLVRQSLEMHGVNAETEIVTDGESALAYLSRMGSPGEPPCPDLLLLDLNLPKADGAQVLSELRKHPQCCTTPVIIMTSSQAPRDRTRMAELGIAHYFPKPLDLDAFLALGGIVREVLRPHNEDGDKP